MIVNNGAELLKAFTQRSFQEHITQVTPGIWHVLGYGHSNAIFIEGETSVILVDTLDTLERGQRLEGIIKHETGKPVKTVIYTHCHPDHRGGAGAFSKSKPEYIAFAPKTLPLERTEWLQDVQNLRGGRQFGYDLTDAETISQGIGIREGMPHGERRAFVAPATVYNEDKICREIDGVKLELVRLPGESDDQIMVWLPEKEALCCGDNYYGCWPNLYPIRGGQYRDIAGWIRSLEAIMACRPQYLLPGHTAPLVGKNEIQTVLGNFKGAIDSILTQTLRGMNEGKTLDTLAAEIRLPKEYASLPYLGEFYGCVDWTVRAVYTAYMGWFDGNPTRLHPLPPAIHAEKTIALMGGQQTVQSAAQDALNAGEFQWSLELCDLLLACGNDNATVRSLKADALLKLAECETSANGRHYYIACAHDLRKNIA